MSDSNLFEVAVNPNRSDTATLQQPRPFWCISVELRQPTPVLLHDPLTYFWSKGRGCGLLDFSSVLQPLLRLLEVAVGC